MSMNYSERLGLELVAKTRALMAESHGMTEDWSAMLVILSLASLIFLFILLTSE